LLNMLFRDTLAIRHKRVSAKEIEMGELT
jgi:hypothetical protein